MNIASHSLDAKTVLITGGAARLGAMSARTLHAAGAHIVIHYRHSQDKAKALQSTLLKIRPNSASLVQADLMDFANIPQLLNQALDCTGRLDILVNNASTYYPTPVQDATGQQWDDLFGTNVKAPFFLAKAAADAIGKQKGCIINMVDIHAIRPNLGYPIYSMAKAANGMMVKTLARELAPDVRVNGVAPGAILWPQGDSGKQAEISTLPKIPLARAGKPEDIAQAVLYLATADYVSGQIITVDGGRTVQQ